MFDETIHIAVQDVTIEEEGRHDLEFMLGDEVNFWHTPAPYLCTGTLQEFLKYGTVNIESNGIYLT